MQDKAKRKTYFRNMSRAMATMCDIFATVMSPKVKDVRMDGIWGQVEFPTLERSDNDGVVRQVEAISPNGKTVAPFWTRGSTLMRSDNDGAVHQVEAILTDGKTVEPFWTRGSTREIKRRGLAAPLASCGTDDATAGTFDEGGDLEVDW
jgi:hypothetical protein